MFEVIGIVALLLLWMVIRENRRLKLRLDFSYGRRVQDIRDLRKLVVVENSELKDALESICSTAGAGIYNRDYGAMKHNSIYIRNRAAQALGRDDLVTDK